MVRNLGKRAEYDMKALGEKLRELRIKNELTEREVGQYLYVSPQAVHKWEQGRCFPAVDNLFALCELYKVDPLDVMVKKGKSTLNRPTYIGVKDTNVKTLKRMQMYLGRIMDKLF